MLPPVPKESLPQWVQDIIKNRTWDDYDHYQVGDKVYGILYAEPNGTILSVSDDYKSITVGWDLNPKTGKYSSWAGTVPQYFVRQNE